MIFVIILILLALYLAAIAGRRSHPGLKLLQGWSYAHRGLHGNGIPENSMAAFRASLAGGYGIEFDLHLLKDGSLAVIHDSSLKRTTGREGRIEDLTAADLKNYPLEGTAETIPSFQELLDLYDGKAPLIVELKPVNGNHAALTEKACDMLRDYPGPYCIESFDPRCIRWLREHRPQIIRGQLSENFFRSDPRMKPYLQFFLSNLLENFLTRPDFIAYKFADRKSLSPTLCRWLGIQGVTWTLRSKADYDTAVAEHWLPIFEGFRP